MKLLPVCQLLVCNVQRIWRGREWQLASWNMYAM